ncbi:MAG: serine/threonine protein kinase [Deltaproteobacteria bacterium]|nr:serine/threonine protein kinase [Deltaproteobacteria bacterium]
MSKPGGEQGRRLLPTRIGRYDILGELGAGGMAIVYLARAKGLGGFERLVAIKRLHEHLCREDSFVRMFLDEARIAARLHHSNVVAVHDVSEDDGRYFLVMDYVRGEPLAAVLNHAWRGNSAAGFPTRIAAFLFSDIADALDAAHELRDTEGRSLGVIHRDISTRNLLFGYDGILRLLDFGVAKTEDQSQRTRTGAQKGTVAYMSPEQILARPLDRRVDIFSLGIVLWETTVGKRLFQAENDFATAARVRQASVPKPSTLRPGYPKGLEEIVLRALQRDPDQRYQTAGELATALREFLSEDKAILSSHARDYLRQLIPGRLEKKMELERSAFLGTGRIPLPRYASEEGLNLEISAGLPEFTLPESARPTARHESNLRDETVTTAHTTMRASSEEVASHAAGDNEETAGQQEPLRTYHGGDHTQDTSTQETLSQHSARFAKVEEETYRDGLAGSPGAASAPRPATNLRLAAPSLSGAQRLPAPQGLDDETERPPEPRPPPRVSTSRLVSGLELPLERAASSGLFELRPEDLVEISDSYDEIESAIPRPPTVPDRGPAVRPQSLRGASTLPPPGSLLNPPPPPPPSHAGPPPAPPASHAGPPPARPPSHASPPPPPPPIAELTPSFPEPIERFTTPGPIERFTTPGPALVPGTPMPLLRDPTPVAPTLPVLSSELLHELASEPGERPPSGAPLLVVSKTGVRQKGINTAVVLRARTSEAPSDTNLSTPDGELGGILSEAQAMREPELAGAGGAWGGDTSVPQDGASSGRRVWIIAGLVLVVASVMLGATIQVVVLADRPASMDAPPSPREAEAAVPEAPATAPELARAPASEAAGAPEPTGIEAPAVAANSTTPAAADDAPPPPELAAPAPTPGPAQAQAQAPTPVARRAPQVELRFEGLPAGARIETPGTQEGSVVRLTQSSKVVMARITARGYQPLKLQVSAETSRTIKVQMTRVRRGR